MIALTWEQFNAVAFTSGPRFTRIEDESVLSLIHSLDPEGNLYYIERTALGLTYLWCKPDWLMHADALISIYKGIEDAKKKAIITSDPVLASLYKRLESATTDEERANFQAIIDTYQQTNV